MQNEGRMNEKWWRTNEEWWRMNDARWWFQAVEGFCRQTDKQTDIGDCRVAFATEKLSEAPTKLINPPTSGADKLRQSYLWVSEAFKLISVLLDIFYLITLGNWQFQNGVNHLCRSKQIRPRPKLIAKFIEVENIFINLIL